MTMISAWLEAEEPDKFESETFAFAPHYGVRSRVRNAAHTIAQTRAEEAGTDETATLIFCASLRELDAEFVVICTEE